MPLQSLPDDLIQEVLLHCHAVDVISVRRTSRAFARIEVPVLCALLHRAETALANARTAASTRDLGLCDASALDDDVPCDLFDIARTPPPTTDEGPFAFDYYRALCFSLWCLKPDLACGLPSPPRVDGGWVVDEFERRMALLPSRHPDREASASALDLQWRRRLLSLFHRFGVAGCVSSSLALSVHLGMEVGSEGRGMKQTDLLAVATRLRDLQAPDGPQGCARRQRALKRGGCSDSTRSSPLILMARYMTKESDANELPPYIAARATIMEMLEPSRPGSHSRLWYDLLVADSVTEQRREKLRCAAVRAVCAAFR